MCSDGVVFEDDEDVMCVCVVRTQKMVRAQKLSSPFRRESNGCSVGGSSGVREA